MYILRCFKINQFLSNIPLQTNLNVMFHEKIGKASVQVGTCWPDSGSGGVADCMNWGTSYSRKPTPPGVTQPEQNTMYPWGPKLYPPPMPPSEQREAYPWQKDMKKLPNTPAPDMNRCIETII